MTIPRKNTLLCATLTIVLATLLIQGAAFAQPKFGRDKLKGTSKTEGYSQQMPGAQYFYDARDLSYQALHKVNDALKDPSIVEKTPQGNTKRVITPPKDPRVAHLEKANGWLEQAGTGLHFEMIAYPPKPTSQNAQILTAQAIGKINEAINAIKLVAAPNKYEIYLEPFGEIKNYLEQANQELKLANAKTDTEPNFGK